MTNIIDEMNSYRTLLSYRYHPRNLHVLNILKPPPAFIASLVQV